MHRFRRGLTMLRVFVLLSQSFNEVHMTPARAITPAFFSLLPLSLALAAALPSAAMAATAPAAKSGSMESATPLIARSALFGNPVKSGAQLSPDGQWLSWMAPVNGVMNVWVAPADKPEAAKAVTDSKDRPIPGHFWSGNSEQVLFIKDTAGDENFRLYGVDLKSGQQRDYTPYNKVRVRMMARSNTRPDELLIGINNRDPRWHDVHLLNLKTGELKLLMQGDGFAGFLGDDDLNVRMGLRPNAAGGQDFFPVQNGKTADKPVLSTTLEDSATAPLGYTRDGKTLYWMDSRERDTTALFAEDVASGKRTLLAEDARADLGASLRDPVSGVIQAYAVDYLQTEWKFLDKTLKADFDWLQKQLGQGEVIVSSRTPRRRQVDRRHRSGLQGRRHLSLRPAKAREATGALRRPPRAAGCTAGAHARPGDQGPRRPDPAQLPDPAQGCRQERRPARPTSRCPWCCSCTAAPWARDGHGYNGYHQWLANRGYAVLAVNFRASTGFGKKFLNAGNKQWGPGHAQTTCWTAVDWAVKQGVTTKDKGRHHGRQLWRLRSPGRRGLHADHFCLRGGHRRPLEPGNPAGHHPAVLGGRQEADVQPQWVTRPPEEGKAILRARLAALQGPTRSCVPC